MSVRTLLVIVGIIVAAGGGYVAWRKLTPVTVYVVNGFDIPIKATIGKKHIVVAPYRHGVVHVRCRPCQVVVTTESGVAIDREELDPSSEHIVFNPLGASTLANDGELYNIHGMTSLTPKPSIEYFFVRVIEPTGVDYYLDAPSMIPKGDRKGTVEIRVFHQHMGWQETVRGLIARGREAEAAKLLETVISFQGQSDATASAAQSFAPDPPRQVTKRMVRCDEWYMKSAENEVELSQHRDGETCSVTCGYFGASPVWTAKQSIASSEDTRFVAPDCSRVIVLHNKQTMKDRNAVSVYDGATLAETHKADEYAGGVSNPHIAPDGHHLEFTTADNRTEQLLLMR